MPDIVAKEVAILQETARPLDELALRIGEEEVIINQYTALYKLPDYANRYLLGVAPKCFSSDKSIENKLFSAQFEKDSKKSSLRIVVEPLYEIESRGYPEYNSLIFVPYPLAEKLGFIPRLAYLTPTLGFPIELSKLGSLKRS
ncbi:MAG: hypothetical protein ACP5MC_01710 [Candidatus Micrarchaeia archaeon]